MSVPSIGLKGGALFYPLVRAALVWSGRLSLGGELRWAMMKRLSTIEEMRAHLDGVQHVALVPTMGALHEGHLALIDRARALSDHVVVSLFVNPTQFAPHEDLAQYPRPIEADLALCERHGVSVVFTPTVEVIYPPDDPPLTIDLPEMTGILEGAMRPTHFGGVCRVVAKLFGIVQPSIACFGQKDYQQLKIIEAMVRAMALPIHIEACPTVRTDRGIALSSRHVYLSADQYERAVGLSAATEQACAALDASKEAMPVDVLERLMAEVMTSYGIEVDYAVVRDRTTLQPLDRSVDRTVSAVCLVAGRLGPVRLIDHRAIGRC